MYQHDVDDRYFFYSFIILLCTPDFDPCKLLLICSERDKTPPFPYDRSGERYAYYVYRLARSSSYLSIGGLASMSTAIIMSID